MKKALRVALAGLVAGSILGGASSAFANDEDVIKEGPCSMTSDWKLKVGPENAGLDGEWEIDSNVVGQEWQFRIKQNGTLLDQGSAVTEGPSGSFTVDFAASDQPGTDKFVAQARNAQTGESCKGTVSF
jgi:hypothetical protein